jgi:cell surface protein SprA
MRLVSIQKILVVAVLMLSWQGFAQNDSLQLSPAIQNLALKNLPSSFVEEYTYDPTLDLYIYTVKVGEIDINAPLTLTPEEYLDRMMRQEALDYMNDKQALLSGDVEDPEQQKNLLPDLYVRSDLFRRLFGSDVIQIIPKGSVGIDLGVRYQKSGNPALSPRNQSSFGFDFDQRISVGLVGNIGERFRVNANYDTQSTFDFQNLIKLDFFPPTADEAGQSVGGRVGNTVSAASGAGGRIQNEVDRLKGGIDKVKSLQDGFSGNEDGILQKLEIGNVSMPLNSSLISGAQSLFGVKADLKFGNTNISAVISEQRSQTQRMMTSAEGSLEEFSLFALDYEEDRHFFLAQYFRDQYDFAIATYPYINTAVQITRVEVWVTNRNAQTNNVRNLVALQDLGETNADQARLDDLSPNFFTASSVSGYPDNKANQLSPEQLGSGILTNDIRDIATTSNGFGALSDVVQEGIDYAVLESARKLESTDYTLHPKLGYISLRQRLNNDEILAVAFQYTVGGQTFQVGEFAGDGVPSSSTSGSGQSQQVLNNSLVVKLLRSNLTNVEQPVWDLMMKNIYNIGAYQLDQDGFVFNLLFSDPSPINYITPIAEDIWPEGLDQRVLLNVFGVDRLNIYNDLQDGGDGFFDFVEGITVDRENGRIIFPKVEPFGEFLFDTLQSDSSEDYDVAATYNANQNKYVFPEMYKLTKSEAIDFAAQNKFLLKGRYKSSGGGAGISLGAFNVPRGSVRVTAGGRLLQEGIDYSVNYQLGRVTILNESLQNSNVPIEVSTESNSFFGQQNKRFSGVHVEHKFSDNFLMGATVMNLSERPLTQKANYGLEPVNNTMLGMSSTFSTEVPFLTRMVNKLPNIDTEVMSNLSFRGEIAYLLSQTPKGTELNGEATTYVDDFEGAQSNIDLRDVQSWSLSSVPAANVQGFDAPIDDLSSGHHRARLAWYTIDPVFYSNQRPSEISNNDLSKDEVRRVFINEIFPQQDLVQGQTAVQYTMDLAYYPEEKGPYNTNPYGSFINDPSENWAGITRALSSTNFDQSNVEYIEFWLLDTFSENDELTVESLGDLIFDLGSISEDVLRDGRKQYENGLPGTDGLALTYETGWARTPATQSLVYAFDANGENRSLQDVGYDGLSDIDEGIIYSTGFTAESSDPAGDNYQYFLQANGSILNRYKRYNGTDGNSILEVTDNNRGSYTVPDAEDLNKDNTMNTIDSYFEYRIPIQKNMQVGSHPFITDVRVNNNVELANGDRTTSRWLQFKIPVVPEYYDNPSLRPYYEAVNNMSDLRSVRFMRMWLKGFTDPVVLRFGTLDLVRGDWRRYNQPLNTAQISSANTSVDVSTVNILENENRIPINYKLPPGVVREQLNNFNTVIRQNEQSLSLRVQDLEPKDLKGFYKNIDIDMRQYKRVKMFVHAESIPNRTPLPGEGSQENFDKRMVAFMRIGTDMTENYYQIEVPLKPTSYTEGVSNNLSADDVWQPESNSIDIPLSLLTGAKAKAIQNRSLVGATYFDEELNPIDEFTPISSLPGNKKYKIAVRGNPTLGQVRTLMIGVKNPSESSGDYLHGEVWFNELRLAEIDTQGGWASVAELDANFADFATINLNGNISTVGFGNIDQIPNLRNQDDTRGYGINTNVNVGQLLPKKWGVQLPLSYSFAEEFVTPKYDPFYQDLKLQDRLDNSPDQATTDAIRNQAVSQSQQKSINLVGVRKQRGPDQRKDFFDIENFDLSYAYNEEKRSDYEIEDYSFKNLRMGAGYQYGFEPLSIEPFSKLSFINTKSYLQWLSAININPIPASVSLSTNINRTFNSQQFREVFLEGVDAGQQLALPKLQQRNYMFDWMFTLNHNLTKSLRFDFTASSKNIVRNYYFEETSDINKVNQELDIWDGLWDVGDPNQFSQRLGLTYNLPFRLLPLVNFIDGTYSYSGDFNWQRGSESLNEVEDEFGNVLGVVNTIQNANTNNLNATFNFQKIYRALKLEKNTRSRDRKSIQTQLTNSLIGLATALKRVQVTYSENNGTVLPGYSQNVGFLGTSNPGLSFALGSQSDIRYEAAKRGWLTEFPSYNGQFTQVNNTDLTYSAEVSFLEGLQLDINGNRSLSENRGENYIVKDASYNALNPNTFGNFEISTILINTAFGSGTVDDQSFEDLKANRLIIAKRLANERGLDPAKVDADGFPVGYGKINQAVLIPAFLSAYAGQNPKTVPLTATRETPLPNWALQYTGLMKTKLFKKYFQRFSIAHGYRASHTLNNYQTNLNYDQILPDQLDQGGNFLNETLYTNINLVEQFNPLVKVDFELKNSFQFSTEIKKDRALALSLDNNLLTETSGKELTIGVGYRLKSVPFRTNFGGKRKTLKGDINIKGDLSVRDNITIVRNLDLLNNQVTAGQRLWSLKLSADYALSRNLTALFFYDHTFSKFAISTAFPQTNIRSGVTLRYNFGN